MDDAMAELKPITCSACGAGSFEHDSEGNLVCTHCGTKYASPRETVLCPACGTENPGAALKCMKCGLNLGRVCPACNHLNPPGTENCMNCATPLDALAAIQMRRGEGKRISDAMREQRLVSQKGADMAYMDQQRRSIDAEENARQQMLARQRAESVRQQRIMMIIAIAIVGCMLVAGIVLSTVVKAH
jgi:hypothetical protein